MSETEIRRVYFNEWRKEAQHVGFYLKPDDAERINRCRAVWARTQGYGGGEDLNKFIPLARFYKMAMELFIAYYNLDEDWDT